jgi:hypothetical protein
LRGSTEVTLELDPGEHVGVHGRGEHIETVLPLTLGHVHREVSVAEELGALTRPGPNFARRDADAAAHTRARGADLDGFAECSHSPFGDDDGLGSSAATVDHDGELVSSKPCDELVVTDDGAEALPDDGKQLVPGRMSERVVDLLEVVQVDEQDTEPAIPRFAQLGVQVLGQGLAIRESGERVGVGLVSQDAVARAQCRRRFVQRCRQVV